MKLISLYIENFGGLSRYSLRFSEGVTVIAEPNGFGKTTLAEFIRAMFYGFPRKAKTLEKSRRQKYTPWNGGKCGGNLVFEFENHLYRIERTFGATPKSDTFKLIDLATNKKSDRFSEDIGLELFQLDADSFERSTYCPQLQEGGSFTTNTIQAKLTHLVEDTGDINNFDKAMEALRSRRSGFIPYRGNGGSVAEARNQVSQLQRELDQIYSRREELEQCQQQIARLEESQKQTEASIAAVRADITMVSEEAAATVLRREYQQLQKQKKEDLEKLARLRAVYPKGIPDSEQIDRTEEIARRDAVLAARQVTTQEDLDAQEYVRGNRERFEGRVPDQTQLEQRRRQHRSYEAALTEIQSIGLSEQEQVQYKKLLPLYHSGALEAENLEILSRQNRELNKLRNNLELAVPEPEDAAYLEELERFFSSGVPGREELEQQRQNLVLCQQLRQETSRLAAGIPVSQPRKTVSPMPLILTLLMGLAGSVLGVVLLVKQLYLWGGISLGAGVLALIAAVFLGLRMMLSRELSGGMARMSPELQARMDENRIQIEGLEQSVSDFVCRYGVSGSPSDALSEISGKAGDYETLVRRTAALEEKRSSLKSRIKTLEEQLRNQLVPLPGVLPGFEKAIQELHVAREQFLDLQEEKTQAEAKKESLRAKAREACEDLTRFLGTYFQEVAPERFGSLLAQLQRESEAYLRCKNRTENWQERLKRHEYEVGTCSEALDEFFDRYDLQREDDVTRQLRLLRDDGNEMRGILARSEILEQRLEALRSEAGEKLFAPQPENLPDLEELKWQERKLNGELTALTRQLLQERQNRIQLRGQVDRIPQIQDELDRWQEKKNADQKNAALLDDTMDFLQKARDSLSGSYLGPIREYFTGYLNRLTGEMGERVLISPELEVQLERQGQARELAFFSAGQTDLVMLCMRLALVDALFADIKPFVILDDPFVNLDDERTVQALELLQELGKDRQILYLVCNSSRSF